MRKLKIATLLGVISLAFAACGNTKESPAPQQEQAAQTQQSSQTVATATQQAATPAPIVQAVSAETKTMNCVVAGLKADGRTSAQAKTLQATDLVTINGTKVALGNGNSYYSRCQGPTLEEQLAAAKAEIVKLNDVLNNPDPAKGWVAYANGLAAANAALKTEVAEAKSFDFFSPEALILVMIGLIIGLAVAGLLASFMKGPASDELPLQATAPRTESRIGE